MGYYLRRVHGLQQLEVLQFSNVNRVFDVTHRREILFF